MLHFFKNLKFSTKISLTVLLIIFLWIGYGLLFNKKVADIGEKSSGEGNIILLGSEIQSSKVHKIITGYGVVDRDRIDVISEVNSHVSEIFKQDGVKIQKGQSVVGLLSGIIIPAPITGRLDKINVKKGDIVFTGQTKLFSIISLTTLDAIFNVSAADARYINSGDKVFIKVNNFTHHGEVYFISKISDKINNAFEIKVRIKKEAGSEELFHGETVKIIVKTILKRGIFVPTSAISINSEDEITISFLTSEGTIKKAKVEVLQALSSGLWVGGEDLPEKGIFIIRGGDFIKEGETPSYTLEEVKQAENEF